jgi:hypothetical protein
MIHVVEWIKFIRETTKMSVEEMNNRIIPPSKYNIAPLIT